jgi:hypothetical protein
MKFTILLTTLMFINMTALSNVSRAVEITNNFDKGSITNSATLIGNVFTVSGDSFIDNWHFTITPTEQFSAIAADIDNLPAFEIGFSSFGAKLIGSSQTWEATNVGDLIRFDSISLAPGNYNLQIVGTVTGSIGAAYAGTMSAFTTPVPEVNSNLMMLVGLGLVTLIASRRKMVASTLEHHI